MSRRPLVIAALWLAAFGVGLAVDRPVARYVNEQGWEKPSGKRPERTAGRPMRWSATTFRVTEALKVPGEFGSAVVAAVGLLWLHPLGPRAAVLVLLAGALSGLNGLLKWVAGRRRPVAGLDAYQFDPFVGGLRGLTGAEADLAFPSGHACLAFATATALAMLLPRWRWAFFAVAAMTAAERVFENAHHMSDSVAGAGIGVLAALAARSLLDRYRPAKVRDDGRRAGGDPRAVLERSAG